MVSRSPTLYLTNMTLSGGSSRLMQPCRNKLPSAVQTDLSLLPCTTTHFRTRVAAQCGRNRQTASTIPKSNRNKVQLHNSKPTRHHYQNMCHYPECKNKIMGHILNCHVSWPPQTVVGYCNKV